MRYLVRTTQGVLGPFTTHAIRSLLAQGKLREDTVILRETDRHRVRVDEVLSKERKPRPELTTSFYKAKTQPVQRPAPPKRRPGPGS